MIKVVPSVSGKTTLYYQLQLLRERLPTVVIKGLPTVNRAIIHMDESKSVGRPTSCMLKGTTCGR